MPRKPGFNLTGIPQHVIQRGNNRVGRRYVYYINHTCHRTGTLWEGRYKSSLAWDTGKTDDRGRECRVCCILETIAL